MYRFSPQISSVQHSFLPICVGFSSKLRPRPSVLSSPLPLLLPLSLFSSTNRMESTTSLLSPNSQQTVDSLVDGTSISAHTDAVAHLRDRDFLSFVEDAEPFSGYYVGGYHRSIWASVTVMEVAIRCCASYLRQWHVFHGIASERSGCKKVCEIW